jgi:hypothetical protein
VNPRGTIADYAMEIEALDLAGWAPEAPTDAPAAFAASA